MNELADKTAVILAGGLGTRLRSVVSDRPKVLAEVCGKPFMHYLLEQLRREGTRRVVICTGYMADLVQQTLGSSFEGMQLDYSTETKLLGTGGALRLALDKIDTEQVVVLNGDSYCDARLDAFALWHAARGSRATLLLSETDDTRRFGRVDADDEGRITHFAEKADTAGPGWINAGIYLLNRSLIEEIEPGHPVSLERAMFPKWIGNGLHGFRSEGRLWDIGVPDAYAKANEEFLSFTAR